ncbi:hypothetical protein DFQ28_006958 [Apophysomyces sp. BC1034]|nr:hypothetical protein DFQ28_006958 [Apophysomyces sp. BC1034]
MIALEHELGVVDDEGTMWLCSNSDPKVFTTNAKSAVYLPQSDTIYVLKDSGKVDVYTGSSCNTLRIPPVRAMAASHTHVLFYTTGNDPIYALGSNRFSQLGQDHHSVQSIDGDPQPIGYFSGLSSTQGTIACGLFHSAVILDGDLYTFGWKKDGRLGWSDDDGIVGLAVFIDDNNEEIEINAVKVACGSMHTLVVDDKGYVWTCGSNKYGQLGRTLQEQEEEEKFDNVFRRCSVFQNEKAIDCYAGRWNSFVLT